MYYSTTSVVFSAMSENVSKLPAFYGKDSGLVVDGQKNPGATFSDWRFKVLARCRSIGDAVYDWVRRAGGAAAPQGAQVQQKYRDLFSTMINSQQDDALTGAKALPEAQHNVRGLLEALDALYFDQSRMSRVVSFRRLISETQADGESVDAFVAEKQRLLREELLNEVDVGELLMSSVVSNIKPAYGDLISTVVSANPDVDVPGLLPHLRDKEKKVDADRAEVDVSASHALAAAEKEDASSIKSAMKGFAKENAKALKAAVREVKKGLQKKKPQAPWKPKAKKGAGKKGKGKNKKPTAKGPQCWGCGEMGHKQEDCPKAEG